jgi:hypothetical protein
MAPVVFALAEMQPVDMSGGAKNAIFIGVFFIIVIAAIIWWLRR